MFFDDYDRFRTTSTTATSATRLNLRHQAMIEANRDILQGARVLDLASHDGRWSFAALQAGASHVTGVEARPRLVRNSRATFGDYGIPRRSYRFLRGDMFEVLRKQTFDVDVVMCLGFMYHTVRYPELLRGIRDANPKHLIIDTKVTLDDRPVIELRPNATVAQSNAARDEVSHGDTALAGWPSVPALELMLGIYDFEVEDRFDWPSLIRTQPDGTVRAVRDYHTGNRVTLRCRTR